MLLTTKFHIPVNIGRLTERPHLESRLDEGVSLGCPLLLVTAPAGYGKSTLVSGWLRKQNMPFSWLSLDSGDNDPGQFLSYLVGALQKIDPNLGASQQNRIQIAESADSEAVYADVIKCLVNEIAGQPEPFLLVLDDCHLLKNQIVLQMLNFLVDNQPAALRLLMISREDLPLPVSRLRVRRQLMEVRQSDLQFSSSEAEDFLREGMGITQLTEQDILALEQHTEGWIAGLQLAGLSIKADPDPAHFIQSFTGSDRYILDYFMEEVFTRQPKEIRDFLLASSILDRFCAPLCDKLLTGFKKDEQIPTASSQLLLERLERSNLFLIPLDNQRNWYRYHHLFSDLLRHALTEMKEVDLTSLHLDASRWLEENGHIPEAVQHAFKSQDWTFAAQLVERHAWNMILHSQVSIVSEWCRMFPEEIISQRPALCIFHGWALVIAFKRDDFPAAIIRIEQAQAAVDKIDAEAQIQLLVGTKPINLRAWVTGHLTLLRSFILMAEPRKLADPAALVELGILSTEQLPVEDITGRSVGWLDVSYASQARCDVEDADRRFQKAISVALTGGNYFGAVVAEFHRAHGLFTQGKLRETIAFCQEKRNAYAKYFSDPIREMPAMALFDQAEGCALLELNELEHAEKLLRSGLEVGQWMPREELPAYLALARLCEMKGDLIGMEESWRRLDMRWPDVRYCTEAMRVAYKLKSNPGEPEMRVLASAWAETHMPEVGPGILIPGVSPAWYDEADHAVYVAWAKIQILLDRPEAALQVIQPMLEVASQYGLVHRIIELSLLASQAYYVLGDGQRAWKFLQETLSCAESNGYLRIIDGNPVLFRLMRDAANNGIAPDFIRRIMEISRMVTRQTQPEAIPPGKEKPLMEELVEPLSRRELEVLALMSEGLSNSAIAERLFLSPNTLKAHTQNIYGKLSVHNRLQAVNRARDLKLI